MVGFWLKGCMACAVCKLSCSRASCDSLPQLLGLGWVVLGGVCVSGGVEVPAGDWRRPAPPRLRQWGAVSAASEPACRRAHAALFSGSLAADGWALAGKCPACAVASCLARERAATHCHSL